MTSTPTYTEVDEGVDQGVGHCFSTRLRKMQTRALPACFGIQDSKLLAAHQSVLSHTESDAALCAVKQNSIFVLAPRLETVSSSETQPPRRRKKSSNLFGFVFFLHEVVVADAMLDGRLAQQQPQYRAHVSAHTLLAYTSLARTHKDGAISRKWPASQSAPGTRAQHRVPVM